MRAIKSFSIIILVCISTSLFSQSSSKQSMKGSNFNIYFSPLFGYIDYDRNIKDDSFIGAEISVSSEKSTLKKTYLRLNLNYLYQKDKKNDFYYTEYNFLTINPEYYVRIKNRLEIGAGVSFGTLKPNIQLGTIDIIRGSNQRDPFMYGSSISGIYNFNRFFTSITGKYHIVPNQSLILGVNSYNNTQVMLKIGYRL